MEILILRKKKKKSEEKKGREDEVKEPKVMIRSVVSPIRFDERLKEKKKNCKKLSDYKMNNYERNDNRIPFIFQLIHKKKYIQIVHYF